MTASDLVANIGTALTPVVAITVTAILGNGLGSKHAQLGTRIRDLTAELRDESTSESRRRSIRAQLPCFATRQRLSHCAHVLIYVSALVFVLLVIRLTFESAHGVVAAVLFVIGLLGILGALAFEIAELLLANRTIARELEDNR
jgi:hypothetical protein